MHQESTCDQIKQQLHISERERDKLLMLECHSGSGKTESGLFRFNSLPFERHIKGFGPGGDLFRVWFRHTWLHVMYLPSHVSPPPSAPPMY